MSWPWEVRRDTCIVVMVRGGQERHSGQGKLGETLVMVRGSQERHFYWSGEVRRDTMVRESQERHL